MSHQQKVYYSGHHDDGFVITSKGKKILINGTMAIHGNSKLTLTKSNGTHGWFVNGTFISLMQVERAINEPIMSDAEYIEFMKKNPGKWGKSKSVNEIQSCNGYVAIESEKGIERIFTFRDKKTKEAKIKEFLRDTRNLKGYWVTISFD
jgi:hypothetical protein